MRRAPQSLRLFEIILWVLGISLLGAASGATFDRWHYQAEQERALFERAPAPTLSSLPAAPAVKPAAQPEMVEPLEAAPPEPKIEKKTADPDVLGRIEIPRLGISAIVSDGDDDRTLARAVGRVQGSAQPGESGNMVLAGHRDTFFRRLDRIETNDRIRLTVPPNTYEYRVESVRVVAPEETSVLDSRGVEEITLVTCYPFRFAGPAPDRFIVSATRIR
ncbi:MAG TPA: class D sortase [Thermoanaerobaculia bacterium]|nr:class D sortase [Thermoanaerobaculia bacterium]